MPTERFIRLHKEKQQAISKAVVDEFQRTTYGELQISNIARSAHISRGSIYTYFYDKEDIFRYAIRQMRNQMLEYNKKLLLENGGDYWAMIDSSLRYHLEVCSHNQIYRLVYLAQQNTAGQYEETWDDDKELLGFKAWVYEHVDKNRYPYSKTEFNQFQDRCQAQIKAAVQQYLTGAAEPERILSDLKQLPAV